MRGADIQFPLSRRHSASYAIALAAGSHVTRRVVIASPCESAEKLSITTLSEVAGRRAGLR